MKSSVECFRSLLNLCFLVARHTVWDVHKRLHAAFWLSQLSTTSSEVYIGKRCTFPTIPRQYGTPLHSGLWPSFIRDGIVDLETMNNSSLIPIELLHLTICVSLSVALSRPASRFGPLLQHSLARVTCPKRTFHPGLGSRSAAGDLHHLHAPLLCGHWRSPSPSCTAAGGCLGPLLTSASPTRAP